MKKRLLLALSLLVVSIEGKEVDVDTSRPAICNFSSTQQNRIAVREGAVRKLVCLDPRVAVDMEPESGQAFIYVTETIDDPVTVSCVTSGGYVQDLIATFTPESSQVVVLHEPADQSADLELVSDSSDRLISTLQSILSGGVPGGYVPREPDRSKVRSKGAFGVSIKQELRGPFDLVRVYEVKNQSSKTIVLQEGEWSGPGVKWVYLNALELKPHQKTNLILGESI